MRARPYALPPSIVVLVPLLALGWGSNWPVMKVVMTEMAPLHFRVLCLIAGAVGLFAIAQANRLPIRVPKGSWPRLVAIAAFNVAAWNVLAVYGVTFMESGRAAILAYTFPVWSVLLGVWFLREPLTGRPLADGGAAAHRIGDQLGGEHRHHEALAGRSADHFLYRLADADCPRAGTFRRAFFRERKLFAARAHRLAPVGTDLQCDRQLDLLQLGVDQNCDPRADQRFLAFHFDDPDRGGVQRDAGARGAPAMERFRRARPGSRGACGRAHAATPSGLIRPQQASGSGRLRCRGMVSLRQLGRAQLQISATSATARSAGGACPRKRSARTSCSGASSIASGRASVCLLSFSPLRFTATGRCMYRGIGQPSRRCNRTCRGVEASRSAPRTTSVMPCSKSSTTTASW